VNGLLVVDKPVGPTSHHVVSRVRRLFGTRKVGHAGTLDPEASGVLLVCIGQATRLSEYLLHGSKSYEAEITFGIATDTLDRAGKIVEECDASNLSQKDIVGALSSFVGMIEQIPPAYSAIHVDGRRAYDLARSGQEVVLEARKVTIHDICLRGGQFGGPSPSATIAVSCGGGTYIRSLCRDVGRKLGYPAYMSALSRTKVGPFALEDAVPLERLEAACQSGPAYELLLPMQSAVVHLNQVIVDGVVRDRIRYGASITCARSILANPGDIVRVESVDEQLLALYKVESCENGQLRLSAVKVFVNEE